MLKNGGSSYRSPVLVRSMLRFYALADPYQDVEDLVKRLFHEGMSSTTVLFRQPCIEIYCRTADVPRVAVILQSRLEES